MKPPPIPKKQKKETKAARAAAKEGTVKSRSVPKPKSGRESPDLEEVPFDPFPKKKLVKNVVVLPAVKKKKNASLLAVDTLADKYDLDKSRKNVH